MKQNLQTERLLNSFESLAIYRGVLNNSPARLVYDLLVSGPGAGNGSNFRTLTARLFEELAARAELSAVPQAGNLWQNHLLDEIITAENSFTRMAANNQLCSGAPPAAAVKTAAAAELVILKQLLDIDFTSITPERTESDIYPGLINQTPPDAVPVPCAGSPQSEILELKKTLLSTPDWAGAAEILAEFHLRCGCGLFCRYHALRWDGKNKKLAGISDPDPVRIEHLVGYDSERGQIMQNTERLLAGLPAGNILLYGDRGTGKSSTVKALVHKYGSRGLRVIELPRGFLDDYQEVLSALRNTCLNFVIFIDDLSFEDHEPGYKALKSMIDGSLQANPENVVIYATSNRRHLVREYFDERQPEVRNFDTLQEKLSLSDRFGITVLFLSPDQELYLKIVENLALQKGIDLPGDHLRMQALEWERWHNCRSGRTARQFVDHLAGSGL